ncbi:MAG: hypothetical protein UX47_C0004G0012 [Candidatus Collierbacteria bacterium GW2011_GWA2_46_26]|uniref:Uncharacterized protein n=1 Tax=Candidatus Collierbacteria bacterium GW2011_GWA2_46_26 TaxID=1618381 RepID=A0A0G1PL05_9BACT|nr:MAG: hypothetical protein UX47_C0004G0012 [Candidatus Collierbacteria bacterium GW2011_GWA2_46_26]
MSGSATEISYRPADMVAVLSVILLLLEGRTLDSVEAGVSCGAAMRGVIVGEGWAGV